MTLSLCKIVKCFASKPFGVTSAVVAAVVAGQTRPAYAHLVSTDLGPFYDGAAHTLVSPPDLLTIIGFAILAAHGGVTTGRRLLLSLTLAWGAGVIAGFALMERPAEVPVATAAVILMLGISRLVQIRIPPVVLLSAAAVIGLARGVMNGAAARAADGQWLSVVGVVLGVFVLGSLLTGFGTWLEKGRAAVVLRVVGSWIAAIGLLMLGWELRS